MNQERFVGGSQRLDLPFPSRAFPEREVRTHDSLRRKGVQVESKGAAYRVPALPRIEAVL